MPICQYLNLFGTQTPWYGICAGAGLLAIGIWMKMEFDRLGMDGCRQNEILFGFPFMVASGVLFAFLLDALFTSDWKTWDNSLRRKFGFTYTGWLLGCLLFICVYGRFTAFGSGFILNLFLPVFALSQAIGRVGCFLGGCCYGIPCRYGFAYPQGSMPFEKMGSALLFPIQLVEAMLLSVLFLACLRIKFSRRGALYLMGVAVIRFVCEFFRADERGCFAGITAISPQQIMSCIFFVFGVVWSVQMRLVTCKTQKICPHVSLQQNCTEECHAVCDKILP